jgi:hypothetical protein
MALTQQQKIAIAHAYAPILYFHPEEEFVPIRPEFYFGAAALWEGSPPTDMKKDWGHDKSAFPRQPRIPRFGISLDPNQDTEGTADSDNDGVNEWYLGHVHTDGVRQYLLTNSEIEHWLDSSGWAEAQDVTETSKNDRCNKAGALDKWREQGLTRVYSDWYYAEVQETSDLERILLSLEGFNGKPFETILRELLGEIWVVWYYFLYPIHEEYLRRCEQVFDVAHRGDYEGDWSAVGVVIQQPATLPWDHGGAFPQPLYVGYGVRLRGLSKEVFPDLFKQGMIIRPWGDVQRIPGTFHPRVFVTKGYHNNYSLPGDKDPSEGELLSIPLEHLVCEITEEVDEVANDAKETLEDIEETFKDSVITIAKIVAGSAIGFGLGGGLGSALGAFAGAVAGVIEALSTSNTDDVPSEEIRQGLEREPGPPDRSYGLVLKPADVANPLLPPAPPAHPQAETAVAIRNWLGTDADRLVDRSSQIWWPSDSQRKGYDGRWGVRCENDPNNRRSGIKFPDFRRALLNDLAVHLAKTTA